MVQAELLVTVASLVVRNEYCVLVEEYGGLMHVLEAIVCIGVLLIYEYKLQFGFLLLTSAPTQPT